MAYLTEFFSSSETDTELCDKLIESGFEKDTEAGSLTAYKFPGEEPDVKINILEITGPNNIARDTRHDYCFRVSLEKPLEEYESGHPVFRFFGSLEQPCAHGTAMDQNPRYGIQEYIRNTEDS